MDAQVALVEPSFARVEISGPLGVGLGLLVINEDWIQLFVPREKSVFRFPASEMNKDTLRRQRFLGLLPVPLIPDVYFDALLTRVALPKLTEDAKPSEEITCRYLESPNVYELRVPQETGGRWLWIDPVSYAPLRALRFNRVLPALGSEEVRPDFEFRWSKFQGTAPAVLPTRIEIYTGKRRRVAFRWASAESWDSVDPRVFSWTPPPAAKILDY